MKKLLSALLVALSVLAAPAAKADGFKVGPIVGVNINKFSIDKTALKSDNRAGFTAGIQAEFTVPLIGIGADVALMYVNRSSETEVTGTELTELASSEDAITKAKYHYLAIPLHLKYKLSLPAINNVVAPYVFTGPNFAFRLSKEIYNDFQAKKYNMGWDFGLGVEVIKHLQIGACYTLGMNKSLTKYIPIVGTSEKAEISGKTSGWAVTAAYLF